MRGAVGIIVRGGEGGEESGEEQGASAASETPWLTACWGRFRP